MRVVPVAEAIVSNVAQISLRVGEHSRHVRVVFLAGVEQAGDRRRRDCWPAAAPLRAVLHAAVGQRAGVDVGDRLVDDLPRHRDAGVAAAPQSLHLRDGGRALVEVVGVLGAHVAPTAVFRLRAAGKHHRLGEHADEFLPSPLVFFLAEHLGEEEHREAVAVGVAVVGLRVADQAVGTRATHEVVNRQPDRLGMTALRRRRALHQQRGAGQRRHRRRVAAFVGRPVASPRLLRLEPGQAIGHNGLDRPLG